MVSPPARVVMAVRTSVLIESLIARVEPSANTKQETPGWPLPQLLKRRSCAVTSFADVVNERALRFIPTAEEQKMWAAPLGPPTQPQAET